MIKRFLYQINKAHQRRIVYIWWLRVIAIVSRDNLHEAIREPPIKVGCSDCEALY